MWTAPIIALAPALSLLLGCAQADAEADRRARLAEVLITANAAWLAREPDRVAEKFEEMAEDPYDFFRGSAAWYWTDLADPGGAISTQFLQIPEAGAVLVVGDLHPENVGTFRPGDEPDPAGVPVDDPGASARQASAEDDEIAVEGAAAALWIGAIDLDGADRGPWLMDLRRAAAGLAMLAGRLPGCEDRCLAGLARAVAAGWAAEIEALAGGADRAEDGGAAQDEGVILGDLRWEAAEEGRSAERMAAWCEETAAGRRLAGDEELLALTPEESAQVDRLLIASPLPGQVLDRRRRIGTGIASRPALRYAVLWDRGGAGPEDDRLAEFREVLPPPPIPAPGADLGARARFDDNAARVREAADRLWREGADVLYDGISDGSMTFKRYNPSSWFQHIDREDVEEGWASGRYAEDDLLDLAAAIGGVLARAHAGGLLADGRSALPFLAADLRAGDVEILAAEIEAAALADRRATLGDHARFAELIEADALLGWSPVELR